MKKKAGKGLAFRQISLIFARGRFHFICVIAGFNAAELTPKYPDFISERVYALHAAARWWYEYRNEVLLLNNV